MADSAAGSSSIFSSSRHRRWVLAWLVFGFLPALTFLAATEALLRFAVAPTDVGLRHFELFRTSAARDAAFGDSQMAAAVTGVPGMVNLGHGGENLVITEYRVRSYFESRLPRRVVIGANPTNFATYRETVAVSSWTQRYISGLKEDRHAFFLSTLPFFRIYIWDYWEAFLAGRPFVTRRYMTDDGAQFVRQSWPDLWTAEEFARLAQIRVKEQTPSDSFRRTTTYRAFRSILSYLKVRGAEVCLLTTPMPRSYRAETVKNPIFSEARDEFDSLAREFGYRHVDLWDAVDDDRLFADTDHLNESGARQIRPIVTKRCFGDMAPQA